MNKKFIDIGLLVATSAHEAPRAGKQLFIFVCLSRNIQIETFFTDSPRLSLQIFVEKS